MRMCGGCGVDVVVGCSGKCDVHVVVDVVVGVVVYVARVMDVDR